MQPPQVIPSSQQSQPSSQQSFMSQPSSQPSMFRQYSDAGPRLNDNTLPIYTATYSGVNVYEMEVNNVAVMRRQTDNYLNATQILKVAGVEKGRRTKILEKEIQTGEHEKVQGGYGRYQGTWIPYERGLEVCRQYGVEEILHKVLNHNIHQDGNTAGDIDTPTKEQAMAAQRKRMYSANNSDNRTNGAAGTFFKNISATASHAVAAISKARFDSPGPRNRNGNGLARQPSFNRQSTSMQSADEFISNSQQSFVSDYGQAADSAYSTQNGHNGDSLDPPRKRQKVAVTPADSFGYGDSMGMYGTAFPGSPTEPNDSFVYPSAGIQAESGDDYGALRPLPYELSPDAENKRSMLMGLFHDGVENDRSKHDMLKALTPLELDMPVDAQSHTALHWAATLSRMSLLRALISAGANPFRVNASGETALMRACIVTNSMDFNSFPELLDVLGGTIDIRDDKGRTVLHHIAVTSAVKGRNIASRYYLESLLEWVVRQGSAPSSQNIPSSSNSGPAGNPVKMGIGRFMSEIVNAQDHSGDTALNIAARIGNRSIISQLLEVGADPNIANRAGLRPLDFGIGTESTEERVNGDAVGQSKDAAPGSSQKTRESSDEVVNSITHLLSETSTLFQSELKTKQAALDSLHTALRTTSSQLGDSRREFEALQERLKAQQLARQKVHNLTRAFEEEDFRLRHSQPPNDMVDPTDAGAWETDLATSMDTGAAGADLSNGVPPAAVLRSRISALRNRSNDMRRAVSELKAKSKDVELKYRHLVSLCTRCPENDVDALLDGLTRAVESERGDLEIGRVRRFLGGVEGVVH
ncbi:start control protein cdc10 [Thozetella sp. PMI_491]|nr:start control protein cdc10 [Thozetella sp. PMI_491]